CIHCTECGVIAAAPLGDIVIEAGDIEQLNLGQASDYVGGHRELFLGRGQQKFTHVLHHFQRVGIHCVDVEEIVLHLAGNPAEFRQVKAENTVAGHAPELFHQTAALLQQLEKQL